MQFPQSAFARILAILAVLIGGGVAVVTVIPDDGTTPATLTVDVDGLDAGKAPDRTIEVPKTVVQAVAPALEDQLQNEAPAGAPAGDLAAAEKQAADIAETQLPLPTAGATAGFAGCRTSFVRNQSTRRGVRPQVQVLHYTVSANRPGWADVNAVVALFNRSSSQASSNFVIDGEGHCAYIVPIEAKAWTQAAGNPFSISYEIIDTGHEVTYMAAAGFAKLRSVAREVARRTHIPMRRGTVSSSCTVTRTGIVQHRDWGTCGGGHTDIYPFGVDQVVQQLVAGGVTATDIATCRKLNWWRTHGRHHGTAERNAIRRKNALTARGVTCTPHGPVRA